MNIDELQIKSEKILDDYENLSGLPKFSIFDSSEIDRYFTMSMEQLNKLSTVECASASYVLAQFSFYLQRIYNRESAKNRWASDQITKLVCDKVDDYDKYTKYDHKIALISKENNVVERLQSISNYTNQIMERMNFLSTSVKNMCQVMSNLQKAKSYSNKANEYEY